MTVDIILGRTIIGKWEFPNASQIPAERIGGGLMIRLPSTLTIRYSGRGPQPLASNLSMQVIVEGRELGIATDSGFYSAAHPQSELRISMLWRVPSSVLEQYEQMRNGGPVKFTFAVRGEICGLVDAGNGVQLRSAPEMITGSALDVSYGREVWTSMLNAAGHGLNVLVEVPIRPAPPAPWDEIWKSLADARASFDQGGTTGWRNCVTSIRHALELWQQHEQEDHGLGWHAPSTNDRRARTAKQRLDNLRWDLLQCAHQGPHTHGDDWSREEAVFLLSSLAALLGVRNP